MTRTHRRSALAFVSAFGVVLAACDLATSGVGLPDGGGDAAPETSIVVHDSGSSEYDAGPNALDAGSDAHSESTDASSATD